MMENEKELKEKDSKEKKSPSVTPDKGEELVNNATESKEVETTTDDAPTTEKKESMDEVEDTVKVSVSPSPTGEIITEEVVAVGSTEEGESEPEKVKSESTIETVSSVTEGSSEEPTISNAKDHENQSTEKEEVKSKKLETEDDLEEKEEDEDHDDDEEVDYSTFDKKQLVEVVRELSQSTNYIKAEKKAREIKPHFDEIKNAERQEALDRFIADGGEEGDFYFKNDELTERFEANYRLIHDHKVNYIKEQESKKEGNLKKKQEILERLREFVDSEETNIQFDAFKAIQNEWKDVGPIPGAYVKTLWANYNALVDRFFDNRHIYFELKELDRKKNLEAKMKLCEKAEELAKLENVNQAIKELNELHHEYKHVGPVPNIEREALWQRFKGASDAVYDRRKDFIEDLKEELEANLVIKQELADKANEFVTFDSEKIKDWNKKTKELQELQEKWEAVGGLPRAKAKEVNKAFWSSFKMFFNLKGQFFKKLDSMRVENLEKKKELVAKADELKVSTDWQKTANELKRLQTEWREIGPVPEKYRESIYREFKASCDHFFQQKREGLGDLEKDFKDNLIKKEAICDEIVKMATDKANDLEAFRKLQDDYNAAGFVPRTAISAIKSKYSEAVDKFINSLEGVTNEDRQKIRLENQINKIKSGPNSSDKMYRKEQAIRKHIGQLENDIALWKNNMEFFAKSKTAEKLKEEFESKIENAASELKSLKSQLKIVRSNS